MSPEGASVIARLKNLSVKTGEPLQRHLQLFCQEEFLRRLSLSPYAANLILKGGLFVYAVTNFQSRATVDVDFLLKQLPNSPEKMQHIVDEILQTYTGNSFVTFTSRGYHVITPERNYTGVSFQLIGYIENTRTPFAVDIGVGDVIVPPPVRRTLPVQLDGFAAPSIYTYSLESTIAEKLESALERLELNSRMKDFYDIYFLSNYYNFDGSTFKEAIGATFSCRGMPFDLQRLDLLVSLQHSRLMLQHWKQFLTRMKLQGPAFASTLTRIDVLCRPILRSLITGEAFSQGWDYKVGSWTENPTKEM